MPHESIDQLPIEGILSSLRPQPQGSATNEANQQHEGKQGSKSATVCDFAPAGS